MTLARALRSLSTLVRVKLTHAPDGSRACGTDHEIGGREHISIRAKAAEFVPQPFGLVEIELKARRLRQA